MVVGERPSNADESDTPREVAEPDPAIVEGLIAEYRSLPKQDFVVLVAQWVFDGSRSRRPRDYRVRSLAFRSPQLARAVRRALEAIALDPTAYLPALDAESRTRRRTLVERIQSHAEVEERLLHAVLAGEAARQGRLLPDPNPRGRARRRLADEHPERFLELLREEQKADRQRTRRRKKKR